jgi:hypothetical protein
MYAARPDPRRLNGQCRNKVGAPCMDPIFGFIFQLAFSVLTIGYNSHAD